MATKVIKTERYEEIKEAVQVNGGHCPCVPIGMRSRDTICMCKGFRDKIKSGKLGKCICGMYEVVEVCGDLPDRRFEIIAKAKKHLLEATNIEMSPKEMEVLDNFLFRCWQMGWLEKEDK